MGGGFVHLFNLGVMGDDMKQKTEFLGGWFPAALLMISALFLGLLITTSTHAAEPKSGQITIKPKGGTVWPSGVTPGPNNWSSGSSPSIVTIGTMMFPDGSFAPGAITKNQFVLSSNVTFIDIKENGDVYVKGQLEADDAKIGAALREWFRAYTRPSK